MLEARLRSSVRLSRHGRERYRWPPARAQAADTSHLGPARVRDRPSPCHDAQRQLPVYLGLVLVVVGTVVVMLVLLVAVVVDVVDPVDDVLVVDGLAPLPPQEMEAYEVPTPRECASGRIRSFSLGVACRWAHGVRKAKPSVGSGPVLASTSAPEGHRPSAHRIAAAPPAVEAARIGRESRGARLPPAGPTGTGGSEVPLERSVPSTPR